MSTLTPGPDALWTRALEDAGLGAGDVKLVRVRAATPDFRGRFMPPGEREITGVGPEEMQRVNVDVGAPRVVLPLQDLGSDLPLMLGLMRHHAEYARVFRDARGAYELAVEVAGALYGPYRDAGKGSALVYNAIPMMQAANTAAARLVARELGPQFHRLDHPNDANLFRVDRTSRPERMGPELVAFGAIWRTAVTDWVGGERVLVDELLPAVDRAAPSWWTRLLADATFGDLALAAAGFRPSDAERELFASRPAEAWRLAEALIARAVSYGVAVVARRPDAALSSSG